MTSRYHPSDPEGLSRQMAELSQEITGRCALLFEAAHRGGPERAALGSRGGELQALQTELARQTAAAHDNDPSALIRVIGVQRRTIALLDELQPGARSWSGADLAPRPDVVTMHSVAGPKGETLWVAEPPPVQQQRTSQSPAQAPPEVPRPGPPTARTLPQRGAKSSAPGQPATARKQQPRPEPAVKSALDAEARNDGVVAGAIARLAASAKHIGIGTQLLAAGAVIAVLVATTAQLVSPIATHLSGTPQQGAGADNRPKPSERLSQAVAAGPPPGTIVDTGAPAPPKPAPGFTAVVSSHASYADARAAFVTMRQLYPGPLAATAPDIRTAKGLIGGERYELALLPALEKQEAEELCRRLKGLGHATCLVKPRP
jgi:hypothetical protein